MSNRDIGNEIIRAMTEAIEFIRGNTEVAKVDKVEIPNEIDVRKIRENLKLTRKEFADGFGFSPRTLIN